MIENEIARLGIDVNAFFGREKRLRGPPSPLPILVGKLEFAAQCYHGGRNEAFAVGYSPAGREVFDLDLCGAYTTAMALISVPNWPTARTQILYPSLRQSVRLRSRTFGSPFRMGRAFLHSLCARAAVADSSILGQDRRGAQDRS